MHNSFVFIGSLLIGLTFSCQPQKDPILSSFEVYCEMVANGAKPIAFGQPMSAEEMNQYWDQFNEIADRMNVDLYREKNLPVTLLFPASATYEKVVPVVYADDVRFQQYVQYKMDRQNLEEYEASRRMGRLLGYSPEGVNKLIMQNTNFKTLASFSVGRQVTHLYYNDVDGARTFYKELLGLNEVEPYLMMISPDAYLKLNAHGKDHTTDQPNSTAVAFLTDQLPQWYQHLLTQKVPVRFGYKARKGSAHDGFVVEDPEGYLLEFEQFKQHPENERFYAILEKAPRVQTTLYPLNFHGSITWTYHVDLLKMQKYYEEVFGYSLVADQGWTKIYQTSPTAFIGLVDECRGMEDYADNKAVELEWQFDQSEELNEYLTETSQNWSEVTSLIIGPENYWYRLR